MFVARTELRNGSATWAESWCWLSTLNESRTNFVSTPKIDNLNRRLCAKGTMPSTSVHFGLSAGSAESETAIRSSPQAAAFSFRKVKRSCGAFFGNSILKVVSPSFRIQLIVSLSIKAALGWFETERPGVTEETVPLGRSYSIWARFLARASPQQVGIAPRNRKEVIQQ